MSGQPDGLPPIGLVITATATVTRPDGTIDSDEPADQDQEAAE